MMRREAQHVAGHAPDRDIERLAEAARALGEGVKHRLEIRRRARDHPQDFARRSLLLQRLTNLRMRLRQRPILLLQLREQPHVLDGDDGLTGEGLQQNDLRGSKRQWRAACDGDCADRLAIPKHRHR